MTTRTEPVAVSELLSKILERLQVVRGPDARGEHIAWCPFHPDGQGKPPHEPNLHVSERGFICHACGKHGSLDQLARLLGMEVPHDACQGEETYDYRDEDGNLLYQVVRRPSKRFVQRRPDGNGGWVYSLDGTRRVLYRLPELLAWPDDTVFIVEGEKDVETLLRHGLLATTNPCGASKWRDEYSESLTDRDVVILPDNDEPGQKHARAVAKSLAGRARSVKIPGLSGLPRKGDATDWFEQGHSVEELLRLASETPEVDPSATSVADQEDAADQESGSQANRIVSLALGQETELFHDTMGDPSMRIRVNSHSEILHCRSRWVKSWLASLLWHADGKAPNANSIQAALNVLEARARFDGQCYHLSNRVALHDGAIWYDLADSGWRALRVTPSGWETVSEPPTLFRRHKHQKPQVEPVSGGDLRRFLDFVNIQGEPDRLLCLVYLVSCFVPDIPHPIPDVHGPHGAAKSTFFRLIRRVCDPSCVELLGFPRDSAELVQQLSHHWCAFYDNVSRVPNQVSDVLCRAVTGEGFSKRELYSDDEDVIYQFKRCVGLNGINVVARKPDLLDRSILIRLDPIAPEHRKSETDLYAEFDEALPRILGGVFNTLAEAMRWRPQVVLPALPRMADFALWGCAIAEALGCDHEMFLETYQQNALIRNEEILDSSPVAAALTAFLENGHEWRGTATDLLGCLETVANDHRIDTRCDAWPKAANSLTRRLNEVASNLAVEGISVDYETNGKQRLIVIRKAPENIVNTVNTVKDRPNRACTGVSPAPDPDDSLTVFPAQLQIPSDAEHQIRAQADDTDDTDDISRDSFSGGSRLS
jgi:hypothetical protein